MEGFADFISFFFFAKPRAWYAWHVYNVRVLYKIDSWTSNLCHVKNASDSKKWMHYARTRTRELIRLHAPHSQLNVIFCNGMYDAKFSEQNIIVQRKLSISSFDSELTYISSSVCYVLVADVWYMRIRKAYRMFELQRKMDPFYRYIFVQWRRNNKTLTRSVYVLSVHPFMLMVNV